MLAVRKRRQLVHIGCEPIRFGRQIYESRFDGIGDRVQPDYFLHGGLVARDTVDVISNQFLNQLRSGRLVLDQNIRRMKALSQFAHCPLQIGIVHAASQHMQQVDLLFFHPPGSANTVVVQFSAFVRSVPTLDN